jgi:Zn-dependent peptidase ImmA (M78 family)
VKITDEVLANVARRGDRALARARLHQGMTFPDVLSAVEDALDFRVSIVPETDTSSWGTLTGYLTFFPDRREGHVHIRASDSPLYSQFAACHELGHLLDNAHCTGALHERSSIPAGVNEALTKPQLEAELVAEYVAHRIARMMYASPRVAELSW